MKIINRKFHREYSEMRRLKPVSLLLGQKWNQSVKAVLNRWFICQDMDKGVFLINAEIPIYKYAKNWKDMTQKEVGIAFT